MSKHLRTRTEYDFERLEELQRVGGKTFARKQALRKRGGALIVGCLSLFGGMSLAIGAGKVFLPLILCALGAVLLAWSAFFYTLTAWTANKVMDKNNASGEFVFQESDIWAIQGKDSAHYPYDHCIQLLETERTFYVILSSGQGLMLDKGNVSGGTAEELGQWLEEKCSQKLTWVGRKRKPRGTREDQT